VNLGRPGLPYTKSDTHITRLRPNRAFRKDSPPRVEPTNAAAEPAPSSSNHVYSGPNLSGYFATHTEDQSQHGHSSSNSSPKGDSTEITPSGGVYSNGHKKKHITFNTFVEQCIAIDQPKPKETAFGVTISEDESDWYGRHNAAKASYDDGYDEDAEDGFDGDWGDECAIGTDSESDADIRGENAYEDEDDEDDEEDEDDGIIKMHTRRDSFNSKNNARLRSTSKVSTSSSSSSGDYSSSYSSSNRVPPNIRRRRRSEGPTRVSLPRKDTSLPNNSSSTAASSSDKDMVSIAPIAPTMLKTGGHRHTSWDGFGIHGVQSPYTHPVSGTWSESFGDEFSDDGVPRVGPGGAQLYFVHQSSDSESGTPVGLVYMPPPTNRYGGPRISRVNSSNSLDSEAEVELREDVDQVKEVQQVEKETIMNGDNEYHHHEARFSIDSDKEGVVDARSASVPIVVKTPPVVEGAPGSVVNEKDAYDFFGGPDLGEDFGERQTKSSARRKPPSNSASSSVSTQGESRAQVAEEETRGRSRSRSRSRTPSPSDAPQSRTPVIPVIPVSGRSEQISSPSLLSPPQRGRGSIPSDTPSSSRGRSSKTSSSHSDRSRTRSDHSSPLGSLSPEGIGSAYSANGRGGGDREGDREGDRSNRSGGRGRERTERKLTHSVSPDAVENASSLGSDAYSSSSGSQTVVPRSPPTNVTDLSDRSTSPVDTSLDEEAARSIHPTPANSPVISMSGAAHVIARMNEKPPINIPSPQVSSPRLSYSSAFDNEPLKTTTPSPPNGARAPSSSNQPANDDAGVVGKAIGMVSSAGAYLGVWNNGTNV
jgi:hypothetical protein